MYDSSMLHRHLAHENFSLAAIDNVISRGKRLDWAGLLGALFDSLLGATVQAIYYCPACEKETERHPVHLCNTETRYSRGWQWLTNDLVNFACAGFGVVIALLF